ncbi:MAG TPA: adenylate/guanylate cyclase domain-containing protein, partial [Tepidisphaeraceae bacterium]|nr:adenylate/guanylate cyclase domain-containing protein [Tepidisphaeraceae bacterium]
MQAFYALLSQERPADSIGFPCHEVDFHVDVWLKGGLRQGYSLDTAAFAAATLIRDVYQPRALAMTPDSLKPTALSVMAAINRWLADGVRLWLGSATVDANAQISWLEEKGRIDTALGGLRAACEAPFNPLSSQRGAGNGEDMGTRTRNRFFEEDGRASNLLLAAAEYRNKLTWLVELHKANLLKHRIEQGRAIVKNVWFYNLNPLIGPVARWMESANKSSEGLLAIKRDFSPLELEIDNSSAALENVLPRPGKAIDQIMISIDAATEWHRANRGGPRSTQPPSVARWHGGTGFATLSVVFTDVIGSTGIMTSVGNSRWSDMLGAHFKQIEKLISQCDGCVIKSTGDGVLAVFHNPIDAVQFAMAIAADTGESQIRVRAGV